MAQNFKKERVNAMSNKNVNLDAMFMEQYKELTDEELENIVGGSGYKNSGMNKSTYDFLTWLGDMAEGVPYYS